MAKNKRQHTLQAAYLAGFSPLAFRRSRTNLRDLPVWVLNGESLEIRQRSVGNTSVKSYQYSYQRADGTYNHAVDEAFQRIEEQFAPMMRRVLDIITSINRGKDPSNLPESDHRFLANYLYMYSVRTPRVYEWIRRDSSSHVQSQSDRAGEPFDSNRAQWLALKSIAYLNTHRGQDVVHALYDRTFTIESISRTKNSFITTDNPVVLWNPNGPDGLAHEDCQVLFPLNQFVLLRLGPPGTSLAFKKHHDPSIADRVNHLLLSRTTKMAVGRDPEQLSRLVSDLGLTATIHRPSGGQS